MSKVSKRVVRTGEVNQYTLDGKFVARHKNMAQAAKSIGCAPDSIKRATVCGRMLSAKGFRWRYADNDDLCVANGVVFMGSPDAPVRQYTLDGKFVAEYRNIAAAQAALGDSQLNLYFACKRKPGFEESGDYLWRWVFDDDLGRG